MKHLLIHFVLLIVALPAFAIVIPDTDEIVIKAYLRDSTSQATIDDMTMMAESYSRKQKKDGTIKEEKKFIKLYSFKDSLFKVEFLEFYLDGKKQDADKLKDATEDAAKRRRKGRSRDASANPMEPFHPDFRSYYRFSMPGIEKKRGYDCYHILVECRVEENDLVEGDYWFETSGMNLVHAEFHPVKMPSAIKELDMKMSYEPDDDGRWLPVRFHLLGRGRVLFFIKFYFEVEETYYDHKINQRLTDDYFKENRDED